MIISIHDSGADLLLYICKLFAYVCYVIIPEVRHYQTNAFRITSILLKLNENVLTFSELNFETYCTDNNDGLLANRSPQKDILTKLPWPRSEVFQTQVNRHMLFTLKNSVFPICIGNVERGY